MSATLVHHNKSLTEEVPVGFSWTVFLFGFFTPLFRGDIKWAAILGVVAFLLALIFFPLALVYWFFVATFYNKKYLKEKLSAGYEIKSINDGTPEGLADNLEVSERYIFERME